MHKLVQGTPVKEKSLVVMSDFHDGNMGKTESKITIDALPRVKLVLMGSAKVGKTSLAVYQEKGQFLTEAEDTPECQLFQFQETCHGFKVKAILMDSLSDRDLELRIPCRMRCIRNADCAVLVFDYTQFTSFETIRSKLQTLHENEYRAKHVVLIGNKSDSTAKLIDEEEVEKLVKETETVGICCFKTSCRTGEGVREAFAKAVTIAFSGYRMGWELRKPLVWLYDQVLHPETQLQIRHSLSFTAGLCESLPSLFRKRNTSKLPKLDQLPPLVILQVLKCLFSP